MNSIVLITLLVATAYAGVLKPQYGFKMPRFGFGGRVVGGIEAVPHSAPYIVSLQSRGRHFCGGAILSENLIITAGHCLGLPATELKIVAGLHDLQRSEKYMQSVSVSNYYINEQYSGSVGPYDIGLVFLAESLQLNEYVKAIKLPEEEKIHSGNVVLFGWGSTSTSSFPQYPSKLQTVEKPIIEYSKCEKIMGGPHVSPLDPSNVCTGPLDGGISACSGDSGGPLVQYDDDGDAELVGVVSWGQIPCGQRNAPSIYTRVSAYNKWIRQHSLSFL